MIAAVNGHCLAAGFGLALARDLRIFSERASFGTPDPRVGIYHGYGALRLRRAIPLATALEMLLLSDRISAQEAYRVGLVNRMVPHEELIPTANKCAEKICQNAPLALRMNKQLVYRGMKFTREQILSTCQPLSAIARITSKVAEPLPRKDRPNSKAGSPPCASAIASPGPSSPLSRLGK